MITSELFGTAPCGTPVHRYTLNGPEICVRIMDYGATVLGIDVPDIPGNVRDVVLGFDKLEDYFDNPACFGATIGPVANRTAGATISSTARTGICPPTRVPTTCTAILSTVCINACGTLSSTRPITPCA